ncbi:maltose ABC transporter substrate-binding protein [Anaerobacillus alkalidiazotrophicus]|uniref:Maltodextrin-binding protein n=1 Tax=Anaerobacillus alkalidiazotrophicus TaxID=472963 RepID=A0A1S2MCH5_9BACI|nr:maltose ABC transporter substrate-binding protein [Anaerobacillus alkalidiazotrophicus]OIJ22274.1 maltose ABC transporter substrate-binding protein [Anaerobacillus alkalidiazotrophicus]
MKIKNIFNVLATATLSVGILAACSAPPQSAPPVNTTVAEEKSGETQDVEFEIIPEEGAELLIWDNGDTHREWAEYVAEKFTEEYGVPVTVAEVGHTDAPGILQTDGPAGLGADVFAGAHDHAGNMDSAGLIIENFFPEYYEEKFMDAAVLGTSVNDTIFGYPYAIETYALYYNKDLVDEVPETFEELLKISKEFTNVRTDHYGIMFEPGNYYFVHAFLGGYGGFIFGDDNTDPSVTGLNNEGAIRAGEFMREIREASLPLNSEDVTGDVIGTLFNENQVMFRISGPWDIRPHTEAEVNFGVAPLPLLSNGERPTSFSGIKGYYVSAYTNYPDAAALYAKFATSEEMLEKRFEMTGELPPHLDLLESEVILDNPVLAGFLEQAQYAQPMPNIPEMQIVWGPMGDAFISIWNTDRDVQSILDSAVEQLSESIDILNK